MAKELRGEVRGAGGEGVPGSLLVAVRDALEC